MNIKILTVSIVILLIILAGVYLIKIPKKPSAPPEVPTAPTITAEAVENQAVAVVEEELEQAIANMTAENIESALLE
jgi:uncharacterized protein (UPF0333 family)